MHKWILILLVLGYRMGMKKEIDGCCSAGTTGLLKEFKNPKTLAMLKPTHRLLLKNCIKNPFAYELVKATLNMMKIIQRKVANKKKNLKINGKPNHLKIKDQGKTVTNKSKSIKYHIKSLDHRFIRFS